MVQRQGARGLEKVLGEQVDLAPGLESVYSAFSMLHTCRAFGMAPGPIPWTAIEQYADAHEMDRESRIELHGLIREMDQEYLAHQESKRPKTGK